MGKKKTSVEGKNKRNETVSSFAVVFSFNLLFVLLQVGRCLMAVME